VLPTDKDDGTTQPGSEGQPSTGGAVVAGPSLTNGLILTDPDADSKGGVVVAGPSLAGDGLILTDPDAVATGTVLPSSKKGKDWTK